MSWATLHRNLSRKWSRMLTNGTGSLKSAKNANAGLQVRRNLHSRKSLPMLREDGYMELSILSIVKSYLKLSFSVIPQLRGRFDYSEFVEGVRQAQFMVSRALARQEFDTIKDMVSQDAIDAIRPTIESLTNDQRKKIEIKEEHDTHIYVCDVKLTTETGNVKVLEMFVVTLYIDNEALKKHLMTHGWENIKKDERSDGDVIQVFTSNYNFVRKFKDDISSDWGINYINHFQSLGYST